ncbi:MAG: glycosyltransferase [Flavobacteriales bacterium]|nr:glycosyltransferase [Flavobacteriales bacterium]
MGITEIIFCVFVCAAGVQLLIYSIVFGSLVFARKRSLKAAKEPVSVVIAARNEEQNLLENLPLILEQNHPDFEVIVVDDCSYDDTQDVLRAFTEKYDNLKITTIKETVNFFGGKKFAITLGIKAAKNELIVFTDADCKPGSKEWLSALSNGFSDGKEIVLGYGGYEKKGGVLNSLIRFDAIYIAIKYLSFAKMGVPYMGVGRNMAYRKNLFFKNKGFANHQHIKSGDDDLFINETGNSKNTEVVIGSLVNTISKPKESFTEWFHQKRRHLTTGKKYKVSHLILLGILSGSVVFFYVAFLILIVIGFQWQIVLGTFIVRMLIQLLIFQRSEKKMGEHGVWYCAPLFEILLMIIYPIFALSNLFIKPGKWKTI